jgi:hypothetical protein
VKFRKFKGDNRNEEFYTLPFNLNRFFPPTWSWRRQCEALQLDFLEAAHFRIHD